MHLTVNKCRYIEEEESLHIYGETDNLRFDDVDALCGNVAAEWLDRHIGMRVKVNIIPDGDERVLVLEDDDQVRLIILGL
jgi:hypothetical protein